MAFWAGSVASTIVFNGLTFASKCTNLALDTGLGVTEVVASAVGGIYLQAPVSIVRKVARPAMERMSEAFILGASVAAGVATGTVVYIGKKIFSSKPENNEHEHEHEHEDTEKEK
jgi:hypothetical protein